MNWEELFLIFGVTLFVLPPKKWPMVFYHLAKLYRLLQQAKQQLEVFCRQQILLYELEENQKKANQGDSKYKNNTPAS